MSQQALGMIIGGLIPALFFGVSNLFVKSSTSHGIGTPFYLITVGCSAVIVGLVSMLFLPHRVPSVQAIGYAFAAGAMWAIGVAGVATALDRYHSPISELVPLFNMNTLVAVLLALWVFSEWKEVDTPRLLIGAVLIVIGGTMVAKA